MYLALIEGRDNEDGFRDTKRSECRAIRTEDFKDFWDDINVVY